LREHPVTKGQFFGRFLEFVVDLVGKSAIIRIAFSFFAPAFLFLLPSLRKKAGVLKQAYRKAFDVINYHVRPNRSASAYRP
jgi:hypothetical protein